MLVLPGFLNVDLSAIQTAFLYVTAYFSDSGSLIFLNICLSRTFICSEH